jgi:hypothetical protein
VIGAVRVVVLDEVLAHPHVVPLLLTRPLAGPLARRPLGSLQLLEDPIGLFSAAGFDPPGASQLRT